MAIERRPYGGISWVWWVVGAIVLIMVLLLAISALTGTQAGPTTTVGPTGGATVDQITNNPNAFVGRTVTLTADVAQVISPQAFTVNDQNLTGVESLLVIGADPNVVGAGILVGDVVRVSGAVRRFELATVEQELGIDLDDATFAPFEGNPMILASSVAGTPSI